MNPFEASRAEANRARRNLTAAGCAATTKGLELVTMACKQHAIKVFRAPPGHPVLGESDATINVKRRHLFVRNDVDAATQVSLMAHELGHFFLHRGTAVVFGVKVETLLPNEEDTVASRYVESYGPRERQELQANVFAREFLLPRAIARMQFLAQNLSASDIANALVLPLELVRLQLYDALLLPMVEAQPPAPLRLKEPTPAQKPAVDSDHPVALVEAGPGTGKTTTLLLRLRRILAEGADPNKVMVLTFSNKAARELVERSRQAGIPGVEKVWTGTFHSFGLEFLRKFGHLIGLDPKVPVLDGLGALAMLGERIPSMNLRHFDALSDVEQWLPGVLDNIYRAKDELVDADSLAQAVMRHPAPDAELQAKREDTAAVFVEYERLLAKRKSVDLKDLLSKTVRLLRDAPLSVEEYRQQFTHVLVDEYQDVNRASALFVKELSRFAKTLWVVGDANQAIYGFMGASNRNLAEFQEDFPEAKRIPLDQNHRSTQEIIDVFYEVATRNPSRRATRRLVAAAGSGGARPELIQSADSADEVLQLAARVTALHQHGVDFSEQAILTFSNPEANRLAQGLDEKGIPVLFLGNVFERPEICDLLCLLRLAVDEKGVDLVRTWCAPQLKICRADADLILTQYSPTAPVPWRERNVAALSEAGKTVFGTLIAITAGFSPSDSPWHALAQILLEDGRLLRDSCAVDSLREINARMAIWQFVHFCRSPDESGRWGTVKNLPERIRTRVRLGEDRTLRQVPPEAEGLDAVRVLTAHGSKGLEFDAVHLLQVTPRVYEPNREDQWPLVPEELIKGESSTDHNLLHIERHNLLYVALSRARKYLTVYGREDTELPSALNGLLVKAAKTMIVPAVRPALGSTVEMAPISSQIVPLESYIQLARCGRQFELQNRAGGAPAPALRLHQQLDRAVRRVVDVLVKDLSARKPANLKDLIDQTLAQHSLNEHPAATTIKARATVTVQQAARWLEEGGSSGAPLALKLGPLSVTVQPHQVFDERGGVRVRLIRSKKLGDDTARSLTALMQAHNQESGRRIAVEVASLRDGVVKALTTVRRPTLERHLAMAQSACANRFAANPGFGCPRCAFYFSCDRVQNQS